MAEIHLAVYKAAAIEEQDYYRSLPLPILGRGLPCKPRDRYSPHLGLLPLVARAEYSCTTLHKTGREGFQECLASEAHFSHHWCDNKANNLSWGIVDIHALKKVLFAAPARERFEQKRDAETWMTSLGHPQSLLKSSSGSHQTRLPHIFFTAR